MRDLLISIFGVYTPVFTEFELEDGTVISQVASGAAGVDWSYVAAVFIFGIVLLSFFRLIGCMVKK